MLKKMCEGNVVVFFIVLSLTFLVASPTNGQFLEVLIFYLGDYDLKDNKKLMNVIFTLDDKTTSIFKLKCLGQI